MTTKKIVAFRGKRGSGKTTAASILKIKGYSEYTFAAPVKNMLRTLFKEFGIDENVITKLLEGEYKEEPLDILGGHSTRYAMQTLGTEWREMLYSRLWSRILATKIKKDTPDLVVVSDLRFVHEYNELCTLYGYDVIIVHLDRFTKEDVYDNHASEAIPDIPVDYTITNTGNIDDLILDLKRIGLYE